MTFFNNNYENITNYYEHLLNGSCVPGPALNTFNYLSHLILIITI